MQDLQDKVALITGAGSGIGRGTALALARAGCRIVAVEIRQDRADAVVAEIEAAGGEALACACDVSDEASVAATIDAAMARFGRIDILMNNVGIAVSGPFGDTTLDQWRRVFDVNLFAAIRTIKALLPAMLERGEGHIVNVASTTATYPYNVDRMAYNSSKAALVNFSEALAMDVRGRGVGVTALIPGPVRTNIIEQFEFVGERGGITPPDLAVRQPEEVGDMVVQAIREGTFFQPTNEEVHAIVAERGAGVDAFLAKATEKLEANRKAQAAA